MRLSVLPSSKQFLHGWGPRADTASLAKFKWTLRAFDNKGDPFNLRFNLTEADDPLIIGRDVLSTSVLDNQASIVHIEDDESRSKHIVSTYEALDSTGNMRQFLDIGGLRKMATSLLSVQEGANVHISERLQRMSPKTFAIRLHHYGHLTAPEMKRLAERAKLLTPEVESEIDLVQGKCISCPQTGRPLNNRQISLRRELSAMNVCVQIDYVFARVKTSQRIFLHMVDAKGKYSEVEHVESRSLENASQVFETNWIHNHGEPQAVAADPEFARRPFTDVLKTHSIHMQHRPARRHQKIGVVERKNAIVSQILTKLAIADPDIDLHLLASRASFVSNVISGSRLHSSFAERHGYEPSFLGLPSSIVPESVKRAQEETSAHRAIERAMKSPSPRLLHPSDPRLAKDQHILGYVTQGSQGRKVWKKFRVISPEQNLIIARGIGTDRGPATQLAYEDVRLIPAEPLAAEAIEEAFLHDAGVQGDSNPDAAQSERPPAEAGTGEQVATALLGNEIEAVGEGSPATEKSAEDEAPAETAWTGDLRKQLEQKQLANVHEATKGKQVRSSQLSDCPEGLVTAAYQKEFSTNWERFVTEVPLKDVEQSANILPSHVVYKVKKSDSGELSLKARTCIRGDLDREKENLRSDSSTTSFFAIRLLLTLLCLFRRFTLGKADISGAFLQSGPIQRVLYVYPPREHRLRGVVWKLKNLPYGVVDAGRQWQYTVDHWLADMGFREAPGIAQFWVKRDESGRITMIIVKAVDDFLIAAAAADVDAFMTDLRNRFTLSDCVISNKLDFFGATIEYDPATRSATISMPDYFDRNIQHFEVDRIRNKQRSTAATDAEKKRIREIAGSLIFIGSAVLPQASFTASWMQQKQPTATVEDLVQINLALKHLRQLPHLVRVEAPPSQPDSVSIVTFADASKRPENSYGQTGIIIGL